MRWLLLPIGLAAAGFAAWLMLSTPATEDAPRAASGRPSTPAVGASPERPGKPGHAPIDDASRRELDAVLEREGIAP